MKGQKDGQAFDSDGFCRNTVFQYNYSHDNDGGFMLICGRENVGTTIRYNISQNDQTRLFHFYDLINNSMLKPLDVKHVVDECFAHAFIQRLKINLNIIVREPFFYVFNDFITSLLITWTEHIDKNNLLGLR